MGLFLTVDGIARVKTSGGAHEMVVKDWVGAFHPTTRGIFYLTSSTDRQQSTLKLVPLNGGTAKPLGTLPGMNVRGLSVSPDFSRVLYARCDQCEADIMLVENFKLRMTRGTGLARDRLRVVATVTIRSAGGARGPGRAEGAGVADLPERLAFQVLLQADATHY